MQLARTAALLLALPLASEAQEAAVAWTEVGSDVQAMDGNLRAVDTFGATTAWSGRLIPDTNQRVSELVGPDGTVAWTHVQTMPFVGSYDVDFTGDGSRVVFTVSSGGNPAGSNLTARDAATGAVAWQTSVVEPGAESASCQVEAAGGRLFVRSTTTTFVPPSSGFSTSRLLALDEVTGAELWSTPVENSFQASRIGVDDAGTRVCVVGSGVSGAELRCHDAVTGALLWQATDPGITFAGQQLVVQGGSVDRVLQLIGGELRAYVLSTGAQAWPSVAVTESVLQAAGPGRVLLSTSFADPVDFRVLDASAGATLWSGSVSATPGTNVSGLVAGYDPISDRLLLAAPEGFPHPTGVEVRDAATGALVGSFTSDSRSAYRALPLALSPSGGFVLSNAGASLGQGSVDLLTAVDEAGVVQWGRLDDVVLPGTATDTRWLWSAAAPGGSVDAYWEFEAPPAAGGVVGRFERRDLATGAVQVSWASTQQNLRDGAVAASPDGARVGMLSWEATASTRLVVHDAASGAVAREVTRSVGVPDDDYAQVLWSAASDRVWALRNQAGASSAADAFHATAVGFAGQPDLDLAYAPGGVDTNAWRAAIVEPSGDLLVAFLRGRVWPFAGSLRLVRFDGTTGGVAATADFDLDASLGDEFDEEVVELVAVPAAGRAYALVRTFGNAGAGFAYGYRLLAFDLGTLALVGDVDAHPDVNDFGSVAVRYWSGGLDVSDDGSRLCLAGRLPQVVGETTTVGLSLFDTTSGALLATREYETPNPRTGAIFEEVEFSFGAAARTGVIAWRQAGVPGGLPWQYATAFDLKTGAELWHLPRFGYEQSLPAGDRLPERASLFAGGHLVVQGVDTAGVSAELNAIEVAPLIAGPDEPSVASGAEVGLHLAPGADQAGRSYLVLASASGTLPGTPVGQVVVPLVADVVTTFSVLGANVPPFVGTLGVLDGEGTARAALLVPTVPSLAGLALDLAFVVGPPIDFASNAVRVTLVP